MSVKGIYLTLFVSLSPLLPSSQSLSCARLWSSICDSSPDHEAFLVSAGAGHRFPFLSAIYRRNALLLTVTKAALTNTRPLGNNLVLDSDEWKWIIELWQRHCYAINKERKRAGCMKNNNVLRCTYSPTDHRSNSSCQLLSNIWWKHLKNAFGSIKWQNEVFSYFRLDQLRITKSSLLY